MATLFNCRQAAGGSDAAQGSLYQRDPVHHQTRSTIKNKRGWTNPKRMSKAQGAHVARKYTIASYPADGYPQVFLAARSDDAVGLNLSQDAVAERPGGFVSP